MTLPQALDLFAYWRECPPENEMLSMLARVYTTWRPFTGETSEDAHRESLEERWKAGALNAKQLLESTGGAITLDGAPTAYRGKPPGIGPFPGQN